MITRTCKNCNIPKNIEEFPIRADNGNPKYICKECYNSHTRKKNQEYLQKNPSYWRDRIKKSREKLTREDKRTIHLREHYGITLEEYEFLLKIQNFQCAICRKEDKKRGLFVDHNHETENIRGLLCTKCNTAIALLEESEVSLKNAIDYLEFFHSRKIVG